MKFPPDIPQNRNRKMTIAEPFIIGKKLSLFCVGINNFNAQAFLWGANPAREDTLNFGTQKQFVIL